MNKIILGVNSLASTFHHDNGAFLLYGDKYVGISAERLDRIKQSSGFHTKKINGNLVAFSFDQCKTCIDYCLNYFKLDLKDIDLLVYIEGINHEVKKQFKEIKNIIQVKDHHYIHACSTYFSSGFKDAAILTIDGQGKKFDALINQDYMVVQAMFYGNGNKINKIYETSWQNRRKIGIGSTYQMITRLLNLSSEGSTMGLSSYGKENKKIFGGESFFVNYGGDIFLNDYFIEGVSIDKLKHLDNYILFDKLNISKKEFEKGKIYEGYRADLAYKLQNDVENVIIEMANNLYEKTRSKNLCIAGGVGLNSIVNKKILDNTPFENIYIVPGTDDSGLALGSALYGKNIYFQDINNFRLHNAFIGKTYSKKELLSAINNYKGFFKEVDFYENKDKIFKKIAELISEGNIVGCFFGGSEFGPRALGHRSIIGDPRFIENKNKLNKIKGRENWRPIAPAILEEYKEIYFDIDIPSDFMLLVTNVKKEVIKRIPGVTHVDGTSRIQTVNEKNAYEFFHIIKYFNNISGIPLIMNSSFNFNGEPIVETPEDAIKAFLSSELDFLVLENILISKTNIINKFSFKKPIVLDKILNKESKIFIKKEEFFKINK